MMISISSNWRGKEWFVCFRKSKRSYEVVVLHESQDHIGSRGNLILAAECMPQNEKWGEQGWSYRDKKDAWAKFRSVIETRRNFEELVKSL